MRMWTPLPARLLLPAYVLVNNVLKSFNLLKRHIIVVFFFYILIYYNQDIIDINNKK